MKSHKGGSVSCLPLAEKLTGNMKLPLSLAEAFYENCLDIISLNTGPYEHAAWHVEPAASQQPVSSST